ncbi:hypothetical protein CJ739_1215 [Mariniflexile rhizosphaerae]|nr:hypothetical protein CJ739_1215 [Mariniflexile sp. TRM1-10]
MALSLVSSSEIKRFVEIDMGFQKSLQSRQSSIKFKKDVSLNFKDSYFKASKNASPSSKAVPITTKSAPES